MWVVICMWNSEELESSSLITIGLLLNILNKTDFFRLTFEALNLMSTMGCLVIDCRSLIKILGDVQISSDQFWASSGAPLPQMRLLRFKNEPECRRASARQVTVNLPSPAAEAMFLSWPLGGRDVRDGRSCGLATVALGCWVLGWQLWRLSISCLRWLIHCSATV